MIHIIEMLANLLTTKMGKLLGGIALIAAVVFFFFSINHKPSRLAKLPVISMLEKVKFMERLDLITYHSNEVLMLGDPNVMEKMLEKTTSDSLKSWEKLKNLNLDIEEAKLKKQTVVYNQSIFQKDLISLQKKVDSIAKNYHEMGKGFDSFLRKLREYSTNQVKTTYGNAIDEAWKNYTTNKDTDYKKAGITRIAKREHEENSRKALKKIWLEVKKERLNHWQQLKKAYDRKERNFNNSTNQRVLKQQNKSIEKLRKTYETEQKILLDARLKVDRIKKGLVQSESEYQSNLNVKNPRLLAVLPAQVSVYLDLKNTKINVLNDSIVEVQINSFNFDPVEVVVDSSKHYNEAQRKIEFKSQKNSLYFDVFEQLQLGVDVIKKHVLDKVKSDKVIFKAHKKAEDYFNNLFNVFGYKVKIIHKGKSIEKGINNKESNTADKYVDSKKPVQEKVNVSKTSVKKDTIKGIDVSHFNGDINWKIVSEQHIEFAYAKATQGGFFNDPKFSDNWVDMKKVGIRRGAYHFYSPEEDPVKQANFFMKVVGVLEQTDLPPMLDLEGSNIGGLDISQYQSNVLQWLDLVEKHYGISPIIYTDNPFANQYLDSPEFSQYKLWIAEYTKALKPQIPNTWKNKDWYIWQYAAKDKLKGINGYVDHDIRIR